MEEYVDILDEVTGDEIVKSSVCYHIRKDADGNFYEHTHDKSGYDKGIDEDGDGLDDLKEDKSTLFLSITL